MELVDDVFDPCAALSDACTDGINLGVKACNRDLGALSGLTRNRLYLHDSALNFRYFKLKQPLYKAGMRP